MTRYHTGMKKKTLQLSEMGGKPSTEDRTSECLLTIQRQHQKAIFYSHKNKTLKTDLTKVMLQGEW